MKTKECELCSGTRDVLERANGSHICRDCLAALEEFDDSTETRYDMADDAGAIEREES